MARCVVTRKLPFPALERLRAEHEIEFWRGALPPSRAELRDLVAGQDGAEGILSMVTDAIDAELIDACPKLRAIANFAVGTDNIDVAHAAGEGDRGREHARGAHGDDRRPRLRADPGGLQTARRVGELGSQGGVVDVGAGRLARQRRPRLDPGHRRPRLDRRGRGSSRRGLRDADPAQRPLSGPGRIELDQLLAESDVVSLHCPLTPETRGLIDERALMAMKQSAILINTARGEVVDSEALRRGLEAGWIAGAGLDVTDPEPLPGFHPLLGAPHLTVVPHIGSASHATRGRMAEMAVANLLAGLAGEPMPSPVG